MSQSQSQSHSMPAEMPVPNLLDDLAAIVGGGHLLTDEAQCRFFSTDLASEGELAACVVQPASTDEVARVLARCTGAGVAVVPRGGGYSYTGGYRPARAGTVMVDLRRLDRIVEINEQDLYVTVQAGVTWQQLYTALKAKNLRTPYFGPMSGYWATVGGALSQGSFFLGSTQHGTVAESVLSIEVVLADGSVLHTGSAASTLSTSPFFRWYGPDLSGLFLSDTGAMGMKTRASLRLIPWPEHQRFATFALDQLHGCVSLVSEVGRQGIASECYSWDPTFVKMVGERSGMLQDLKYLAGVVGSGASLLRGVKDAARMALAGKRLFDGSTYLVHVTIDDVTAEGAQARLERVRSVAARLGAGEIDGSVPRVTRAVPFTDFKANGLATQGIRNLPTNALAPHSKAQELAGRTQAFFDARKAEMAEHGITWGVIVFAVGAGMVCVEPLMYWNDPQFLLHDRQREQSDLAELARAGGPTAAARAVAAMRRDLVALYTELGCAHVQIGKSYRWAETREPEALRVIRAVKQLLDPAHLVNPGSLGL